MKRQPTPITARARQMRRAPPLAEKQLWHALRSLKAHGVHFTRQLPAGPYFLDFACRSARLAIELDGGQHAGQVVYDRRRTAWLEAEGWRVVRLWNADVLADPVRAAEAILAVLRGEATVADIQAPHPAVDAPGPTGDPTLSLP